jgi:hypothetical protein
MLLGFLPVARTSRTNKWGCGMRLACLATVETRALLATADVCKLNCVALMPCVGSIEAGAGLALATVSGQGGSLQFKLQPMHGTRSIMKPCIICMHTGTAMPSKTGRRIPL